MFRSTGSVIVFLSVISLFFSAGLDAADQDWKLVSEDLLSTGGFDVCWQNKLPFREGEKLSQFYVVDDSLYALSSENYMVSMNRISGGTFFNKQLEKAGIPIMKLRPFKNDLYLIIGTELVELARHSGDVKGSTRLGFGVSCPPSRNSGYFYVADTNRRLRYLRAKDKVKLFEIAATNESIITSVTSEEKFVIFATAEGDVIKLSSSSRKSFWEFKASDGIIDPLTIRNGSVFFTSKDTNVYRVNLKTGLLVWKQHCGAIVKDSPKVTENTVYQFLGEDGLAAFDVESGKLLWKMAEVKEFLTEVDGKAFVMTKASRLAAIDNKAGEILYSINLADVKMTATTTNDSYIYIADEDGRVACIKPIVK
ncbi:MAG: PQQ-binding-like beta-propeller repeat protein [Planctomycetes bacterium]|nr:PQQ-binding-like beta-propeller repeat protein [Planctomycetota bacterium]MBL7106424.1 PQQ-binding-like beta-propeller repeat protein [Phycisphaerae bacterium]